MAGPVRRTDATLIALFLDMLAAERGAGKNTLSAYERDLTDFSAHVGASKRAMAKASTEDVRAYLRHLSDRGFAAASVARQLSAIRQFYRFLYAEGQRGDDPAAIVEGPRRSRGLPKVLSIAEVDRLLTVAREARRPEQPIGEQIRAVRLNCLLELVYATGLRVSELVALPASAAARNAGMLIVRGKGEKERLVPLNEAAKTAMTDYRALTAQAGHADSKWLFPSFGASSRRSPSRRACAPRRSARMYCATPLPVTCSTTAPTCAWCRPCSAMPIFRPRRSIPMCWRTGSRAWCGICIRWVRGSNHR
jgi:integrase/recombinase XerD